MKALRHFLDAIKFEHTVFALPFAYIAMMLAARGWPSWHVIVWVTLAMVGGRTLAMSVNRLADRFIDARNPRTAGRHLPTGLLTSGQVATAAVLSAALLFFSAWRINPLCLALAPLAAVFLIGYSYTKRFTWLSHWILGFTDGIAAAGGWIAVREAFDPPALILWFALTVWIGGFDLIYACQDIEFDRANGLYSIPAQFGAERAFQVAEIAHGASIGFLATVGALLGLPWPFWIGVGVAAWLLLWEHRLVRPDDLTHIDMAFFTINSYLSLSVFAFTLLATILLPAATK